MSQHDMVVDDGPGLAVRTDMNAAIQALASCSSGPIEPTVKYPGQIWLDTSVAPNGHLRQRDQGNTAWIDVPVAPFTDGNMTQTVYISSGTWSKPAGLKFVEVTVIGGGGGGTGAGATAAGQSSAGGGGGGAGMATKLWASGSLGPSVSFTVGSGGGAPSGSGLAGGASSFGSQTAGGGGAPGLISANGAVAGSTLMTSTGGGGGAASGGDINIAGGVGSYGVRCAHGSATSAMGGVGGVSWLAMPSRADNLIGTAAGTDGRFPGGGGSGGVAGPSAAGQNGSLGGAGCIIIREYF